MRYDNEFIRHKLLDAIGDLYLAGAPIVGAYESFKAGHYMNNQLLHTLFADPDNFAIVESGENYAVMSLSERVCEGASL